VLACRYPPNNGTNVFAQRGKKPSKPTENMKHDRNSYYCLFVTTRTAVYRNTAWDLRVLDDRNRTKPEKAADLDLSKCFNEVSALAAASAGNGQRGKLRL
ncbi:hypothetical protein BaRGS_00010841, partial [Batillaria attramentaria]